MQRIHLLLDRSKSYHFDLPPPLLAPEPATAAAGEGEEEEGWCFSLSALRGVVEEKDEKEVLRLGLGSFTVDDGDDAEVAVAVVVVDVATLEVGVASDGLWYVCAAGLRR